MSRPHKLLKKMQDQATKSGKITLTKRDIYRILDYIDETEYARQLSEEYAEKHMQIFCENHYSY